MKIISNNKSFENTLVKLIDKYDRVQISVAWASAQTKVFELLVKNSHKLELTTIGTHFYQTDPDVLDAFVDSQTVRFITQPSGVFHPKLYFFENLDNGLWEAVIGSANMTLGAMSHNNEICVHISSADNTSNNVRKDLLEASMEYYEKAIPVTHENATNYRKIWNKQKRKVETLSAIYGRTESKKAPIDSQVMRVDWEQYLALVKQDPYHGIDDRLELLRIIRNEFANYQTFEKMPLGVRKTIAGLPNDFNKHWGWFGSMRGAGIYHSNVNNNNSNISSALDRIPLEGIVTKKEYLNFVDLFLKAFTKGGHGIAVASRLLAMKRPDIFVCLDSKNKSKMCKDFGIKASGMDYIRYWDELIGRIQDSVWWQSDKPNDLLGQSIWNGRAALLDCIFYEEYP